MSDSTFSSFLVCYISFSSCLKFWLKRQLVTDVWCFRAPLDPLQNANPPSHLEQTNLDMSSIQPTSRLYIALLPLSRFPRRPKNFLPGRTGLAGANRSNVLARVGRA